MVANGLYRAVVIGIVWLVVIPVYGLTPPDEGIRAEMAGEWQKAITIYEEVLDKEPGRSDLWSRIADIKTHLKDPVGAINALTQAVIVKPDEAELNSRLATLLVLEKQPERALPYAEKAKNIEPDNIGYLEAHAQLANWLKHFSEAAKSYERIYSLQPDSEQALRNLGNTWSWAGNHDKTILLYEKYLDRHPGNADIWLALSGEKVKHGDWEGGVSALAEAAKLRPDDAKINAELSRLYAMHNQPEKALVYARKAVSISPDNISYLRAHAQIANWLKHPKEAARSIEKIVALKPGDDETLLHLADTYQWAGEQDKATALYEEHLKKNLNDIRLWLLVADSKMRQKDIKGAVELLEKAYARFFPPVTAVNKVQQDNDVKLPVLLYHCIGDRADNDYWMSASEFSAQMKQLKELGYHSITSRDLEGYLFDHRKLPEKPVMITFDDACHNLYTHAWPILKKYGFVADIYIFTGAIRNSAEKRASITQHVNGKDTLLDYLIWPEIREMIKDGFVIGAHTKTHADLNGINREQLKYEILFSKLRIRAETGITATAFTYPFGSGFNRPEVHQELRSAGFRIAFAAHGGVAHLKDADLMKLRRIEIWGPHPKSDPRSRGVSVTPDPLRPYDLFRHRLEPDEAERHYELSRLYSMDGESERAYQEVTRALALDPGNRRYLRDMVQLADWTHRADIAAAGYNKLMALGEHDDELILRQAKIASQTGDLDESVRYYNKYLLSHPDDREASIERIKVESWRGNTAVAMELLKQYKKKFGVDSSWAETKADILSWANRPSETRELVVPLLEKKPHSYEMNFANTLAQHFGHLPRDAISSLQLIEKEYPEAVGNHLLRKVVTTPFRPAVSVDAAYLQSSEDLEALSTTLRAGYSLNPETRLHLKYVQEWFSARQGSGLESLDGSEGAQYQNIQADIRYRFSPKFAADFHVGQAKAEQDSVVISGLGVDIEPTDSMDLRMEYRNDYFHEYFSSSPKTISLGIKVNTARFYMNWRPGFNYRVHAQAGYSSFSDDNVSQNFSLAVSRAVARTQHWNVDLGLSAALLDFDEKRHNGYYDPDYYQRYMLTNSNYWKVSENGGVNISLAVGNAKDDTMDGFKLASEASVSGEFELDDDWLFSFGIGGVHNVTRGGGAYTGNNINASVTRRF